MWGNRPCGGAAPWRIRQPRTHSQKVGSAAEALGARLQASSCSKRDLLRKRRNDGVYEKSPVKDRAF